MLKVTFEPYRPFFLTGSFLGMWGVMVWIFHHFQMTPYPAIRHPATMMGGFLLCFVCGFLMTAAPKFTASYPMRLWEARFAILLNVAFILCGVFFNEACFYFFSVITFLFLIHYFSKRFVKRSQNPPPSFVFIGLGLSMGILGSLGMLGGCYIQWPEKIDHLIRLFYYQGYVMSLFIGVGSRLVPALLGYGPSLHGLKTFSSLLILFAASYLLEVFFDSVSGVLIKNLIVTFVVICIWKAYKAPPIRNRLGWGLIVAAWSMLIGLWGSMWNEHRIHFLHLFFVGGVGLMTFMISIRVVLSHGNHGLLWEKKSKVVTALTVIFVTSALTRWTAGFLPQSYMSHLFYAAIVWCIGVGVWMFKFVPKIYRLKS